MNWLLILGVLAGLYGLYFISVLILAWRSCRRYERGEG